MDAVCVQHIISLADCLSASLLFVHCCYLFVGCLLENSVFWEQFAARHSMTVELFAQGPHMLHVTK